MGKMETSIVLPEVSVWGQETTRNSLERLFYR